MVTTLCMLLNYLMSEYIRICRLRTKKCVRVQPSSHTPSSGQILHLKLHEFETFINHLGNISKSVVVRQEGANPYCIHLTTPYSQGNSICPSDTFRCFVQTNEDMILRFSTSNRAIILVSEKVKFIQIFSRDHP